MKVSILEAFCYDSHMKAILFDRDGTLLVEPSNERVDSESKLVLFDDTIEALKLAQDNEFSAIVVTNQAGIAEGLIDEDRFWELESKFEALLSNEGITILKTYMSPHGSNEVNEWRKPGPGMLLQAAKDYNLDLSKTYMVGDRPSDIEAGIRANAKTILVKTALIDVQAPNATYTAPNLLNAVKYIIENS